MKDNQSHIRNSLFGAFVFFFSFICYLSPANTPKPIIKKVLYINSYNLTYSWSDSIAKGVTNTFINRPDIQLYVEYLDANRFGTANFEVIYTMLKEKYKHISFDVILVSDNDAFNFVNTYGENIAPHKPIIFCGVNNIEDYPLTEKTWIYGFKEEIDQSLVIKAILRIMPDVKKLYFISDATTTSQLLVSHIKREIEPKFSNKATFEYISSVSIDSLLNAVSKIEKNSAIAMINFFRDAEGHPVNSNALLEKVIAVSKVPVFSGNESFLGKGIAGGAINKGFMHGHAMGEMALKFIDDPDFNPAKKVYFPDVHYYFDQDVLQKFNINEDLLPHESIIINNPPSNFRKYIKYILALVIFASIQAIFIFYLIINVGRRRRAENTVRIRYEEMQQQNKQLEEANTLVNNMNTRLEELNENLSETNVELVVAKQRAEEADKLKTSFLANMSHEIRTPLNAIIGFSTLSADSSLPENKRNYYIQVAKSNSDQLLRLIDDILDLSKIESGQTHISNEIFSVNDIFQELYTAAKHNLTNNKVDLRISDFSFKNNVMVKSDPIRFKQILSNLISNAIKFTEEGFIEFGFTIDNKLIFHVKDTGCGIEPDNLPSIFDRFWKTEGNDEKLYAGTGLGLAICKKLCELQGGKIWVESELNKGTVFYFTISDVFYIREPVPESQPSVIKSSEQKWEQYAIAIAEDEESNLIYLEESLRKSGIKIFSFTDGSDIVDFFNGKPPQKIDVVLMDIKMLRMDGFTATKLIKLNYPDVPIIAQTAYAMVSDIKMIKESEFDDFITKPIRPQVLLEKIGQFLEKK